MIKLTLQYLPAYLNWQRSVTLLPAFRNFLRVTLIEHSFSEHGFNLDVSFPEDLIR